MNARVLPVSAVIPTINRIDSLLKTLNSLSFQDHYPFEIIIVDGSTSCSKEQILSNLKFSPIVRIIYQRAIKNGAAHQRMQGVESSTQPFIWFIDDDIELEGECLIRIWNGINSDEMVGATNALITNQKYTSPGLVTKTMYRLMSGQRLDSHAGKLIGPAWNLLPEERDVDTNYVSCEWLNTTCTLYRKEALPNPIFSDLFIGYSLMEDVALSATVAKKWKLLNACKAKIYHDSQPGDHKSNVAQLAEMELLNRHFIMTKILNRNSCKDFLKLILFEMFQMAGIIWKLKFRTLFQNLIGKWNALRKI